MNASERLDRLLQYLKVTPNKFAVEILKYKNNVKIYHIKNGRNNISSEIAKDITDLYPEINYNWLLTGEGEMLKGNINNEEIKEVNEPPTGYYYPEVSASAGLETEMQNDELKRVPINIPGWERGVDFVNVYGDSMYPKYCSGEIIGIKEVEPQYINYGYAYVVIFNDGQVFLKYIKKGKDDEHWLLASENPRYEPKEYHLSLIKKVFIIKGVITKTTM